MIKTMESIRNYTLYPLCVILLLLGMQSCSFLKEISALAKCEFRMGTLDRPVIAGIDVSRINNFTDLTLVDVGIVGASVMRGELPLSFTLNIEARNPNPATAALNRLEYMAYIDDVEIASGSLNQRVEIAPNGGIANIPLHLSTDLVSILNKDSRAALFNFGLNLADASNRPTRVTLKVKPTIMVGMMEIVYPGYFNVQHDFSSGDQN
jgi:LEA14-like dessication related protein